MGLVACKSETGRVDKNYARLDSCLEMLVNGRYVGHDFMPSWPFFGYHFADILSRHNQVTMVVMKN